MQASETLAQQPRPAAAPDHISTLFRTLPHAQDGLLVGAIITFVCAVLCLALIRPEVAGPGRTPTARAGAGAPGSKTAVPLGRGRSRALRQAP